jgi:hypothetical protein
MTLFCNDYMNAKNHRLAWHLPTFKHHNNEEALIFKILEFVIQYFYFVTFNPFKHEHIVKNGRFQ